MEPQTTPSLMNYNGWYFYSVKNFASNTLERRNARCVIIGQTEKSYRIRLLENINSRYCDEELWVRKKSVFRSYFNNRSKICDLYGLSPATASCKACLQRCKRKYELADA